MPEESGKTNIAERRRRIRRLALQMLYQIDAQNGEDVAAVQQSLREAADDPENHFEGFWSVSAPSNKEEHDLAFARAQSAWQIRAEADLLATELSPLWPSSRQPAIDRNIIRLCWFEMTAGQIPPKVAVNEAVELGKKFSTERSGQFLNGVLDKLLRKTLTPDAEPVPTPPESISEALPEPNATSEKEPTV